MDELTQRVAAAGCPPTDWQAPGITPSPVGRTYTQSELDAAVAAERERLRAFAGDTEVVCSLLLSTTNLAAARHALVQQLRDAAKEVLRGPNVRAEPDPTARATCKQR